MVLLSKLQSNGLSFLVQILKDDKLFSLFSDSFYNYPKFRKLLIKILIDEGKKAKNDQSVFDSIFAILGDKKSAKRLLDLMWSNEGKEVLLEVVKNPFGENLILGSLYADYPKAHGFVNQLLQKREGRAVAVDIVSQAALNKCSSKIKLVQSQPINAFLFPSDVQSFSAFLSTQEKTDLFLEYITKNPEDATSLIATKFNDPSFFSLLINCLQTSKGEKFSALIGKTGFGRKYGAGKLWFTQLGRRFVYQMLQSERGAYSIYGIMSGMTLAEFIAYTRKTD